MYMNSIKLLETLENGNEVYSNELEIFLYMNGSELHACHVDKNTATKLTNLHQKSDMPWSAFISTVGRVFDKKDTIKDILNYYANYEWINTIAAMHRACS